MRVSNAEWDFMGRSYLVWSLANMATLDRWRASAGLRYEQDEVVGAGRTASGR